jgi:hypothetical protein
MATLEHKMTISVRLLETTDRRVEAQYLMDGAIITICKPAKPRRSERTWTGASKYSTSNLGAKAVALRDQGLPHAKG